MKKFVTAEQLVKLAKHATTAEEIAKKCGLTPENVYQRLNYMRRKGVKVPRLRRRDGRDHSLPVGRLNAIIGGKVRVPAMAPEFDWNAM